MWKIRSTNSGELVGQQTGHQEHSQKGLNDQTVKINGQGTWVIIKKLEKLIDATEVKVLRRVRGSKLIDVMCNDFV